MAAQQRSHGGSSASQRIIRPMNLASFDIFDTALVRRCGRPETVWRLMGSRLWAEDTAQAAVFYNWRAHAEKGPLATINSI